MSAQMPAVLARLLVMWSAIDKPHPESLQLLRHGHDQAYCD